MKFFSECKLFKKLIDLKEYWYYNYYDEPKAKKIMIIPSLSLYDLMQLRPEEAAKQLTFKDYFKFAWSDKLFELSKIYRKACALHLCEKLSMGFFRSWALHSFWKLIHYRVPILCCHMILDELINEDLCNICLTTAIQSS
ncbi:hypothetical protein TKK_0001133 [Trichogramma kaykai]